MCSSRYEIKSLIASGVSQTNLISPDSGKIEYKLSKVIVSPVNLHLRHPLSNFSRRPYFLIKSKSSSSCMAFNVYLFIIKLKY